MSTAAALLGAMYQNKWLVRVIITVYAVGFILFLSYVASSDIKKTLPPPTPTTRLDLRNNANKGLSWRRKLPVNTSWLLDIAIHREKWWTQSYQAGVIQYILDNIPLDNKFCIEIGFPYPRGGNTAGLWNQGWNHVQYDGSSRKKLGNVRDHTHYCWCQGKNMLELLDKNKGDPWPIPNNPDYIHIDIDSFDLWVSKVILESPTYRPKFFSVEYCCDLLDTYATVADDAMPQDGCLTGASFNSMVLMATTAGYTLIFVEPCMDMYFLRNDVVGSYPTIPVSRWREHSFVRQGFISNTPGCQQHIMNNYIDYNVYQRTGNSTAAKEAWVQHAPDYMKKYHALTVSDALAYVNPVALPLGGPFEEKQQAQNYRESNGTRKYARSVSSEEYWSARRPDWLKER